jgi:hypothetical protein
MSLADVANLLGRLVNWRQPLKEGSLLEPVNSRNIWGQQVTVAGSVLGTPGTPIPSKKMIMVEKLLTPVTLSLHLLVHPAIVDPIFKVQWGSYGKLVTYNLFPGVHVVFGDALFVTIIPTINPSPDPVQIIAYASVCFSQPNWNGLLALPDVGQ